MPVIKIKSILPVILCSKCDIDTGGVEFFHIVPLLPALLWIPSIEDDDEAGNVFFLHLGYSCHKYPLSKRCD
jgi:hypothetical protein